MIVIEHTHDEDAAVYRLLVGDPVLAEIPKLNDEGHPVLDDESQPVLEERLVGYANVHDVVFADDDPRWRSGKSQRRRAIDKVLADQLGDLRAAGIDVDDPAPADAPADDDQTEPA